MKTVISVIVIFLCLILVALAVRSLGNKNMQTVHIPFTSPEVKQKTIGWIPFWDEEAAKTSFQNHASDLTYVSVFWYKITPDGHVSLYNSAFEDDTIISFAHEHHVKIFALVANMADYSEGGAWDSTRVDKVIGTEEDRQSHIQEILALVKSKGFDGVDIDYENLRDDQKNNFSLFIEELTQAAHKNNILVGVAILPKTSETNPDEQNGSHAQDLVRLGSSVDQLYFMTYLEHGVFSDPGPPASPQWIQQIIEYALSLGVPAQKIYMGVGLMGISWRADPGGITGDNSDLTFSEIQDITQNMRITPEWNEVSQTPHFTFTDSNGTHIIWFENNQSVLTRLQLARNLHVGGIAFWRLGGEDPAIWDSLEKIL